MLEKLLTYDRQLLLLLNPDQPSVWDHFWLLLTNKWASVPLYLLLMFWVYKNLRLKPFLFFCGLVALLILLTDQTANLFKFGFERPRPCHLADLQQTLRLVGGRCGGAYGFFSAHAANSFALAVFVGLVLKKTHRFIGPALLIWAFLVALSRVLIGVHYPGDILAGMLVGTLYGSLFFWAFTKVSGQRLSISG